MASDQCSGKILPRLGFETMNESGWQLRCRCPLRFCVPGLSPVQLEDDVVLVMVSACDHKAVLYIS